MKGGYSMSREKFDEMVKDKDKKDLHEDYRKDWRSDKQFEDDIKKAHEIEKDIIEAYAEHLRVTTGREIVVENNGVDNTGKVLEFSKVDTRADYRVNGVLIEVKFNNNMMEDFRFKKSQLNSYIKQGAYVLWVNGWKTEKPEFVLLSPDKMREIKQTRKAFPYAYWGYKMCYELRRHSFKWQTFKKKKKEFVATLNHMK
jgi:hypothetical protein